MSTKNKRRSDRHVSSVENEPMSKDLTQYVTTKQAADLMGVDRTHVNRLLINGRMKGIKLGQDWLVFKPSIDKYLETKSPRGRPHLGTPQLETAS